MKAESLPKEFLKQELLCDQHNLQQALGMGKTKYIKSLSKDMRSQMRMHGFKWGMPNGS